MELSELLRVQHRRSRVQHRRSRVQHRRSRVQHSSKAVRRDRDICIALILTEIILTKSKFDQIYFLSNSCRCQFQLCFTPPLRTLIFQFIQFIFFTMEDKLFSPCSSFTRNNVDQQHRFSFSNHRISTFSHWLSMFSFFRTQKIHICRYCIVFSISSTLISQYIYMIES